MSSDTPSLWSSMSALSWDFIRGIVGEEESLVRHGPYGTDDPNPLAPGFTRPGVLPTNTHTVGYYGPPDKTTEDWSFGDEVTGVSTGITDEFTSRATTAWAQGVEKYRNGDERLPFDGDPLEEAAEECVDLFCYSKEALKQKLCSVTEADMLNCFAFDAYKLIQRIILNQKKIIEGS